ncbi:MAG: FAD-dependent oxidoreductase [Bdellovibrio sp.]|nr:FAD-dependent oxidoreductase [Bdellovibrio sp.]
MSVAIVGAGLSGLTIANLLTEVGVSSVLFEKSKSVGGRMATRRDATCTFDHGAQFFYENAEEDFFWQTRWQKNMTSKPWFSDQQKNYFCGVKGMTSLAKDLALKQNIFFNEKVVSLETFEAETEVHCESGNSFRVSAVILTSPLPQSLDILRSSKIEYPKNLEIIQYAKGLVGLFQIEGASLDINLLYPKGAIFSIASNLAKGISQNEALTVVMNAEFSELYFNEQDQVILELIESELLKVLEKNIQIQAKQLKKWKYSHPLSIYQEKFLFLSNKKIILAGDAFGGGSLNGAVRSARAVFEKFYQDGAFKL